MVKNNKVSSSSPALRGFFISADKISSAFNGKTRQKTAKHRQAVWSGVAIHCLLWQINCRY
ncbi:hypothetical protein VT06_00305 [Arsukibacterium sp. MJ3]|nr:hypothetical protein VT06_00305 [Arsukibacterium sp. MJ3]